jgi:small subunit ribosomal protein S8
MTDPIADYLTRIRNAIMAKHKVVAIPASNVKKDMTKILKEKGFILDYRFEEGEGPQGLIKIALKYDNRSRRSAIKEMGRISKPGLRKYASSKDIPRVYNGLGIAIMSTSQGVMTDKDARAKNVGGEVLCYIF